MRLNTTDNNFLKYLKDEKFIAWMLIPSNELELYWKRYLELHPDEEENIKKAKVHFHSIKFSSSKLPTHKKLEAMHRLEQSLRVHARKRKIYFLKYVAAACAAILILTTLYIKKTENHLSRDIQIASSHIIGNELASENILLISGNKTNSFQTNVDIHVDNDNTAQVKGGDIEREITIDETAMNMLIVPYGKRSMVVLPDGTKVWLNSGSTLEFPSKFSKEESRNVFLTGEMYIEVAADKNKPFYVHTADYEVKVYGTKFNITSYPDTYSSVVLVQGSVSLLSEKEGELFLSPNEQALYSKELGTFTTQDVDISSFISWKDGYLTFDDAPMHEVLKQIERYYNLSFKYENNVSLREITCSGKIILSENIDNVMSAFALISNTKYKRHDNRIYLYKKQ